MADDSPPPEQPPESIPADEPAAAPPQASARARRSFLSRFRRQQAAPAEVQPSERSREGSLTRGGYSYEVVREDQAGAPVFAAPAQEQRPSRNVMLQPLAGGAGALAVVALIALGAWWLIANVDGKDGRARGDVSNLVGLFTGGDDNTQVARFEGELAAGYPNDVPVYPGAKLIASIRQISGENVSYIVIYDTDDERQKVADYFAERLGEDPWQIEGLQDSRDTVFHRFSKTDDADTTGAVFATDSPDNDVTTILVSVQITSGAADVEKEAFDPGEGRPLPENFPDDVPQYPGSTAIVSSFQKARGSRQYVVSLVTTDDAGDVLDFYRDRFGDNGWTVQDVDAGQSPLQGAEAISFSGEDPGIDGQLLVGELPEDGSYNRIDIQLTASSGGG